MSDITVVITVGEAPEIISLTESGAVAGGGGTMTGAQIESTLTSHFGNSDWKDTNTGPPGADGQDGQDGDPGAPGYTPVKGVDYFDGQDGQDGSDADVTFEALNANGDVGTGSSQVARGDHSHSGYAQQADVLEKDNTGAFEPTGDYNPATKKYVDDKALEAGSLVLGETSTTAYRGDRGKSAYDHSQSGGNPHGVDAADVGLGSVDNTSDAAKPVSTAQQAALNGKADATHNHDADYEALGHNHDAEYQPVIAVGSIAPGAPSTGDLWIDTN